MKNVFLITLLFVTFFQFANSQTIDSLNISEKATYSDGDIAKIIRPITRYPSSALSYSINGDVVISFVIQKDGKLDSVKIENSVDKDLSTNSLVAFSKLDKVWKPSKVNGIAINKKYLVVFRYRMFENTEPSNFKSDAIESVNKQKFKLALKQYNRAIKDSKYDNELYSLRANVNDFLGDFEGAKNDKLISIKLKDEVMSIIDIIAISFSRKRSVIGNIIAVPRS